MMLHVLGSEAMARDVTNRSTGAAVERGSRMGIDDRRPVSLIVLRASL